MFDVAIDYLLDDETERAPDIAPMNALNNLHKEAREAIMNTAWKVNLRIQPEYRKIRTRNNSVFEHFSHSRSLKVKKI